ncbi:ABC transporter substrate-binding protein [Leisingera daeponensis]|uniref:ABC transporter substrate-binding protein n=1 Tax=Leisingera daeponensis TaxID=405746 RepID=UPI000421AABC|nr:ABC transporter substrate-binding protein [Leisingera daeponensis]
MWTKVVLSLLVLQSLCFPKAIEAQESKSLVIPAVDTFNLPLHYSSDGNAGGLLSITSEPLIHLAPQDERFVPWLASSVTTNDGGKTWRIALRENVYWSDGEPLDTSDIDFTFDLILTSKTFVAPIAVELRARVESVAAVDDQEFIITLRKADMRFPHSFLTTRREGTFFVIPEHVWDGKMATFSTAAVGGGLLDPLLGSGPYVADSITAAEATFIRNEDWWGAKTGLSELPEPEQVVVRFFEADEDAVEALKADEIDIGIEVDFATFEEIRVENQNVIAWSEADPIPWPGHCPRQLDFNTISPPWDNPALRRAVAHFVDQTRIVDEAFSGQNLPSPTLFPLLPGLKVYVDDLVSAGFAMPSAANPAQGDAELIAAGYAKGDDEIYEKDGEDLSLVIHVADEPAIDAAAAGVLAQILTDSGIATSIDVVSGAELWAWILPPGKFDAAYSWLSCGSVVDPFASLVRYHPKNAVEIGVRSPGYDNIARWNTPAAQQYGRIVDEIATRAPSDEEMLTLTRQAYDLISQEAPFIPLVQEARIVPFSTGRWKGWPTSDNPYAMPIIQWGQFHSMIHSLTSSN